MLDLRLFQLAKQVLVGVLQEVLGHLSRLRLFVKERHLLEAVDGPLEVLLGDARGLCMLGLEEVAVLGAELVVGVAEVEGAAVDEDGWDVLDVAGRLGDFGDGLELEVDLDHGPQVGQVLFLLLGRHGRAAGLGLLVGRGELGLHGHGQVAALLVNQLFDVRGDLDRVLPDASTDY